MARKTSIHLKNPELKYLAVHVIIRELRIKADE